LRAAEIAALRLDDGDWRAGEMVDSPRPVPARRRALLAFLESL
jgi:hypothetical protein